MNELQIQKQIMATYNSIRHYCMLHVNILYININNNSYGFMIHKELVDESILDDIICNKLECDTFDIVCINKFKYNCPTIVILNQHKNELDETIKHEFAHVYDSLQYSLNEWNNVNHHNTRTFLQFKRIFGLS